MTIYDISFGARIALMFISTAVVVVFTDKNVRFLRQLLQARTLEFNTDTLAAGIWASAFGAIIVSLTALLPIVGIVTITTRPEWVWVLYLIATLLMISGYVLHFTAWRRTFYGDQRVFGLVINTTIALVPLGALFNMHLRGAL